MCIGAAKSATTSLYDILRQHSNVYLPSFKEPHFFDNPNNYHNGIEWYSKTYFNDSSNKDKIGDFTPTYLFESNAAERIYKDLGPSVRFIVILRDPVERAYSHYLHSTRDQNEKLSFIDALEKEKERTKESYLDKLRFSYIAQGLYYNMLQEYFKFFPRENFFFISFEDDFLKNIKGTIQNVFKFLDLENENIDVNIISNRASKPRLIWLKRIMNRKGWWRSIIKFFLPSLKIRQIIRNKIHRANLKVYSPKRLSNYDKKIIFDRYFIDDVNSLEKMIGRKMNWGK